LANLTAGLLTQGAGRRSAPQIAEQIEALGGLLDANAGWDASIVDMDVLAKNVGRRWRFWPMWCAGPPLPRPRSTAFAVKRWTT
jgi:hypothetical protein